MPPWHADPTRRHTSRNDARLSDEEKDADRQMGRQRRARGDPKDLPAAAAIYRGWQIPKPDAVIYMRDEPFNVPAKGTIEYQRFVVDPGWTEDKWVKAIECRRAMPRSCITSSSTSCRRA